MNLRLEALKDIKEDLLMRKSKISDEIHPDEEELIPPVMEYNFNDINRPIMLEPVIVPVVVEKKKLRLVPDPSQIEEAAAQAQGENGIIAE